MKGFGISLIFIWSNFLNTDTKGTHPNVHYTDQRCQFVLGTALILIFGSRIKKDLFKTQLITILALVFSFHRIGSTSPAACWKCT